MPSGPGYALFRRAHPLLEMQCITSLLRDPTFGATATIHIANNYGFMNKKSIQLNVAQIFLKLGGERHIEIAKTLEDGLTAKDSLNLRSLNLQRSDVEHIFSCLMHEGEEVGINLRSISLSYNRLLGDSGANAVIRNLPRSVKELGLVKCGIGDEGGKAILEWIKKSSDLTMVCIEGNNFSKELRLEFKYLSSLRSHLILVY